MSFSTMENSVSVWEVLARAKREVISSSDIADLSRRINRKPEHVIRHLRREGYLLPLFRGYYYVRSPSEICLGEERRNPLELFALAAEAKSIGGWYFGLHTALRLNRMTHESILEEDVISDSMYRIRGVPIGTRKFIVHRWAPELVSFGLLETAPYRFSDPEKTVLDLAYLDYWRRTKGRAANLAWRAHIDGVDMKRLKRYVDHYPDSVRGAVEAVI